MQEVVAPVHNVKFDLEISLEQQLGAQPLPFPGMDSACSNKECPFLHIDPESKIKDCPWYDRGFCRHGIPGNAAQVFLGILHWDSWEYCTGIPGNTAPVFLGMLHRYSWECCTGIPGNTAPGFLGILHRDSWEYCTGILGNIAPVFNVAVIPSSPCFDIPLPDPKELQKKQFIVCHSCGEAGHKSTWCPKATAAATAGADASGQMKPGGPGNAVMTAADQPRPPAGYQPGAFRFHQPRGFGMRHMRPRFPKIYRNLEEVTCYKVRPPSPPPLFLAALLFSSPRRVQVNRFDLV
ncbi:PREDICTED: cleavage and polyadenylation specificity factor subunit 4-like [Priapulus caudatus]|uniref:Cleavage and polyadenylation specificity factor subunit 4-like n=1 Tax=Priapulus caudatus TaxID=37621 RepID=A0ABM1EPV9_PRICU|nr:PREDICTED: cleavage and polyadenylation specificity factor subunit 4-like [Priapulus caudatus]